MTPDSPFAPLLARESFLETPAGAEVLRRMAEGLGAREPFLLVTGEPGIGKTTLAHEAVARWGARVTAAFIAYPTLTGNEFLEEVVRRFGAEPPDGASRSRLLACIEWALGEIAGRGQVAVLVVDDAHDLSRELFDELRLLANAALSARRSLEVILVGLPALESRLDEPALAALRQRVSLRARLAPLTTSEIRQYLHHRVTTAGSDGPGLFSRKTSREIASRTGGVPRQVNTLAAEALRLARAAGAQTVGQDHVEAAALSLGGFLFRGLPDAAGEEDAATVVAPKPVEPAATPTTPLTTSPSAVVTSKPATPTTPLTTSPSAVVTSKPAAPTTPLTTSPSAVVSSKPVAPTTPLSTPPSAVVTPKPAAPTTPLSTPPSGVVTPKPAAPATPLTTPPSGVVTSKSAAPSAPVTPPAPAAAARPMMPPVEEYVPPTPAPLAPQNPREWVSRFVGENGPLQLSSRSGADSPMVEFVEDPPAESADGAAPAAPPRGGKERRRSHAHGRPRSRHRGGLPVVPLLAALVGVATIGFVVRSGVLARGHGAPLPVVNTSVVPTEPATPSRRSASSRSGSKRGSASRVVASEALARSTEPNVENGSSRASEPARGDASGLVTGSSPSDEAGSENSSSNKHRSYTIDVGGYASEDVALEQRVRVQQLTGIEAWVVPASQGEGYRIVVGMFRTEERAASAANMLLRSKTLGTASVVPLPSRKLRR